MGVLRRLLLFSAGSIVLVCVHASLASADTFTVTSNADSGSGTLRDAIRKANANSVEDTITFDLSESESEIALNSRLEILSSDLLMIDGEDEIFISAPSSGVFIVKEGKLILEDLKLRGTSRDYGGVLLNRGGDATVRSSDITGYSYKGGGVFYNDNGTLLIDSSSITDSNAGGKFCNVVLQDSDRADEEGFVSKANTVIVSSSLLRNGTVSPYSLATICNYVGDMEIKFSTLLNSRRVSDLKTVEGRTNTTVTASISDGIDPSGEYGPFESGGYNLAYSYKENSLFDKPTDQVENRSYRYNDFINNFEYEDLYPRYLYKAPYIKPISLQSVALDKVPAEVCKDVKTDQRGQARPTNGLCDIGAYERADFAPTVVGDKGNYTEEYEDRVYVDEDVRTRLYESAYTRNSESLTFDFTNVRNGTVEKSGSDLVCEVVDSDTFLELCTVAVFFASSENFAGEASYDVSAQDSNGESLVTVGRNIGVESVNNGPDLFRIRNQTIRENGSTRKLPFRASDVETDSENLTVTAVSSNTRLVPQQNIKLGGSGEDRFIKVTPAANRTGKAAITVSITDTDPIGPEGPLTTRWTFYVTVR